MKANTYLHFNGNCKEAMNFYADVLGGTITTSMLFREAPDEVRNDFPEETLDLILHCTLEVNNFIIMASDYYSNSEPLNKGNNFAISLNTEDEEQAVAIFNGLAEEGSITMPLAETFWGGKFGMLKDKYNVNWMLSLADNTHHNA
ncbi:PhnB protein [Tenacibaculum sp. 190524A02b]|uniref:PhnB protein n=1 Tax=Tenacibaculum vairaonense TaxID=3137860 RepID=A0ABP1FIJ4_9FLAO